MFVLGCREWKFYGVWGCRARGLDVAGKPADGQFATAKLTLLHVMPLGDFTMKP